MGKVLAVDIGGTTTEFAFGDEKGIGETMSVSSDSIQSIEGLVSELKNFMEEREEKFDFISVVSAGIIDRENIEIVKSAQAEELELEPLEEEFDCKVFLENDANAAALGEKFFNFSQISNLVYLVMGSGIGAGVILNGELLKSDSRGGVAEAGFSVISYSGKKENFDRKGVWEAYSSGANLSEHFEDFSGRPGLSPSEIFQMAEEGDSEAEEFIRKIGRINAAGFATVINNFNPEVVVVGGSLPKENPKFFNSIKENLKEYLEDFVVNPKPEIKLSRTDSSELRGAVANALRENQQET